MKSILQIWRRLLFFLRRDQFDRELKEEMRFHLELRTEERIEAGMSPKEARHAARRQFGNLTLFQEVSREMWGFRSIETFIQDLRYGLRTSIKGPGFSAIVILMLALGIGATTAIFSVVSAVLLRPLPYPEPDRLMMVFASAGRGSGNERLGRVYSPDFVELRAQCRVCAQMGAYTGTLPSNLTGGMEPDRVRVARVTDGLFATLGVVPQIGRTFLPEETGRPLFVSDGGAISSTAVILGNGLWRKRFGSDPAVIGRIVRIEGDDCTIVGVMPDGFKFPDEAEAWMPATLGTKRDNAFLRVLTRLQTGVPQAQAQAELTAIAGRLEQEFPATNRGLGVSLVPLHEYVTGNVRSSLFVFLGAVGFVLLIACANVASLLLARAAARQKEVAIRAALGASRLRIVRQLLTESLLLAFAGGGFGLLLALWILKLLVSAAPEEIPRLNLIGIDGWVLTFTVAISVLTGIVFGLAPALQASQPDLGASLKEGGTRGADGAGRHRLRSALVVAEVSLALVLLIGAGLLLKNFTQLRRTELGFNPDRVLVAGITLPEAGYPSTANVKAYYQQALARLSARQEVQAVGIVNALPLGKNGARIQGDLTVEGEAGKRPGLSASKLAIGGDYFRALGIPLLKGRDFSERDNAGSPGVLIISETLARRLWPNENPIGKRLNIGFRGETWREVVGVVGDVKQNELGAPSAPAIYQPYLQVADSRRWMLADMTFVVRSATQPQTFAAGLRSELQALDKDLPLYDVTAMERIVAQKVADPRFYALLLGSFSAIALILAAGGIYGLISYSVNQRTHEIGIRMALGAQAHDVLALVVKQGVKLMLAGLVAGLTGAFVLTRVLSRFLYQVSVTDPFTFAVLSVLLGTVGLLACYVPARRATRVDPITALRGE
jgi:putative ABC transport system permease protein